MRDLALAVGQVGEGRLLVLASLVVADELFEAYKELHALTAGADPQGAPGEAAAAETLEACAQRVEAFATRLGGA